VVTDNIQRVWSQKQIPVVLRGGRVRPLIVRLPFASDNRDWLRDEHRNKPEWLSTQKVWSIPRSWFDDVIKRALDRYGAVYVIQPFRKSEKCAPACWNARGAHCECSCMGANHGSDKPRGKWHVVSDTFAVRIGPREFSCRLLRPHRES
jgi:hypothetical protein